MEELNNLLIDEWFSSRLGSAQVIFDGLAQESVGVAPFSFQAVKK